jgi:hypothetical protein
MDLETIHQSAPFIAPVGGGTQRPVWSVMIPTYNCAFYLRQTLESVLKQDPGQGIMQIQVVDNCSTEDDPEAVVDEVGAGRVAFYRNPRNLGAVGNFNSCISLSQGQLVHILHGDDYVLPDFYRRIEEMARKYPAFALFASRSFIVDAEGTIGSVTQRLPELENGGHLIDSFYYGTPIQTPGVVVRRSFYEMHGGFMQELIHTADCEMWTRTIATDGGVILPDVLACYRFFASNDSNRLARTAENLLDVERLGKMFAERYAGFDKRKALYQICSQAIRQSERFVIKGDAEAAKANLNFWKARASINMRLRRQVSLTRTFTRKLFAHILGD